MLDGRYRIGPRIARGGMASVYEATDLRLDRTVAVKVMHAGLGDDDEFAARFVREARAAARLSHPNVVGVYDQGDDDGTVFLAMELVPGHTLRDVIRKESPMPPARALALMEPVLSALAAAHRAGLIHRDVKPENVLIADDGRVKVADFGLAKAVSADTQHTATGGVLIGTVSYLAPELVVDGRADARADVYAAGRGALRAAHRHASRTRARRRSRSPTSTSTRTSRRRRRWCPTSRRTSTRWSPGPPRATASLRPADAAVLLHQVHRVSHALDDGVRDDPELTPTWPRCWWRRRARPRHRRRTSGDDASSWRRDASSRAAAACASTERTTARRAEHRHDVPRRRSRLRRARPSAGVRRRPPAPVPPRSGAAACSPCAGAVGGGSAPGGSAGPATPRRPACSA